MSTRSTIAYKKADGSITGIYAHWDGYPEHNGAILQKYFQAAYKIQKLIHLGNLSSLRPRLTADAGTTHNFDNSQEDVCVYYGRDRGESDQECRDFETIAEWMDHYDWSDYYYLWNGKEWLVARYGDKDENGFPIFDRLEDVLERTTPYEFDTPVDA